MKFLHRKRGREEIDEIDIIPRYMGVPIHDCWASYLGYNQCSHQLCGSHLLRELSFIVESNGFRWARLMKALLREDRHMVNKSESKLAFNPLVAIQIAHAGKAADMIKLLYAQSASKKG